MKTKMLLLFMMSSLQLSAQLHFSGSVLDAQTNKPVASASILLTNLRGTFADENGNFIIENIHPGKYVLKISAIGYEAMQQTVSLNYNIDHYQIKLKNVGLFIQPIEVTSTRAGKDAPFTKSEIGEAQLKNNNLGRDLPFILNQLPGVTTTSDAGAGVGYTGLWIRGSDLTRINVTINGIPVNDAESAGTFWVDLPDIVSSASSIQVQRGAGTSTNGAGAFGATVNVSTNEFHDKAYASISNSYGSFNTWKNTVSAGSGLLNKHFTVDVRLSSITSDGYIDRATANLKSFYFSTAYLNKKTALRFNIFSGKEKTYQAWNGVLQDSLKTHRTYNGLGLKPDGTFYNNQTDNYTQTYYQLFFNHSINANWNFNIAAFLTRGKGYYEEYAPDEAYNNYGLPNRIIGSDTIFTTDLIRDLWLDNYFYGTIFSLNYTRNKFSSNLGGGWNQYDGKHYGRVIWAKEGGIEKDYQYYYNLARKYDFNIYWKANYALTDKLKAFVDLQYRLVKYNINGFDDNPSLLQHTIFNFFNPKIGFNYNLSGKDRVYISYAIANKEPNRDDFEANQTDIPKAETLRDLEAGYNRNEKNYHLQVDIYYMDYKNQLVLTGKINDVGAYTRTNIPKSYRAGLEANAGIRFAKIFTLAANAAFSRNKIKNFTEYIDNYDSGKQNEIVHGQTDISFSPAIVSGGSLTILPVNDFSVSLIGKYVSRTYLDNAAEKNRSLDPYFVNNLQLTYLLHPNWCKELNFNLTVYNLFNAKYITNGYTYTYIENGKTYTDNSYFPQAGINFLFALNIGL